MMAYPAITRRAMTPMPQTSDSAPTHLPIRQREEGPFRFRYFRSPPSSESSRRSLPPFAHSETGMSTRHARVGVWALELAPATDTPSGFTGRREVDAAEVEEAGVEDTACAAGS